MASTGRAQICNECTELCDELIAEGPYYFLEFLEEDHPGPA
jgi:hypothetical protein